MNRNQKEKFIEENWEMFLMPNDPKMPVLSTMTDKQIDAMVLWYQYLQQKK